MKPSFPMAAVMLGDDGGRDGKYVMTITNTTQHMLHSVNQNKTSSSSSYFLSWDKKYPLCHKRRVDFQSSAMQCKLITYK